MGSAVNPGVRRVRFVVFASDVAGARSNSTETTSLLSKGPKGDPPIPIPAKRSKTLEGSTPEDLLTKAPSDPLAGDAKSGKPKSKPITCPLKKTSKRVSIDLGVTETHFQILQSQFSKHHPGNGKQNEFPT